MNDVIRLLPDSVANQIAAGEVIQRPASVVKELVENAVDAGATSIQVIVKDAGRTLVQVVDNGKGMSDTDARMAFERHATSKIEKADDLFSLHTMGFRGEALASIAAVAQIDRRTMPRDSEIGTRIIINGSKLESQTPEACTPGTNMMVKNLFFNVPVRRKFLKRDSVELSNILREFERLALVNPSLDFEFVNNDSTLHRMIGSSLKQRIIDLFGKGLDKQLLPVSTKTPIVAIDGFIGRPEHARKRNALQYLMVNGRHMRHPYFHKAILMCFEKLIPADSQPNYFLNFIVDPETIDVNIHPTKNEIKFENEAPIWQILSAAVKESLGRFNAVPGIDFEAVDAPEIPVFDPNVHGQHSVEIDRSYNPFAQSRPTSPFGGGTGGNNSLRSTGVTSNWEQLYQDFMGTPASTDGTSTHTPSATQEDVIVESVEGTLIPQIGDAENEPVISANTDEPATLQVKNRYILSATTSGVMIIDQHRAHVKVLYEQIMQRLAQGAAPSQHVMFPEIIELTAAQSSLLESLADKLNDYGFELSFLGGNSWSITAQPTILDRTKPREALLDILEDTAADRPDDNADSWRSHLALSLARSSAIRAGKKLTAAEREHLLSELLRLPTPNYTPDGQVIISILSADQLEGMFS